MTSALVSIILKEKNLSVNAILELQYIDIKNNVDWTDTLIKIFANTKTSLLYQITMMKIKLSEDERHDLKYIFKNMFDKVTAYKVYKLLSDFISKYMNDVNKETVKNYEMAIFDALYDSLEEKKINIMDTNA